MAKEKNKPVPVRFDLKLLEILKEEEKIDSPQKALNFLATFWENNRPAKEGFGTGLKEIYEAAKPVSAAKPGKATGSDKKESKSTEHPSGLSGIDLSIWKAEQKEKDKKS